MVIVGAGIAGCAVGYYLAKAGVSVRIVDKSLVANGQSGRNWGWVRRQGCDPAEVDLVGLAARCWTGLAEEVGESLTLRRDGLVSTTASPSRLEQFRAWLDATDAGTRFGSRIVSPSEIRGLAPMLEGDWLGGLYTPGDGHADPVMATRAIAAAAERAGAVIETGTTVLGLMRGRDRVTGVRTTHGQLTADTVVVAAGAWSSQLLRSAGIDLPIRWVRATAARTEAGAPHVTDLAIGTPNVGFSQLANGSVVFGSAAWSDYDITLESLRHVPMFLPNYIRNRRMFRMHLNRMLIEDIRRRLPLSSLRRNVYAWRRVEEPPPNLAKIRGAHDDLRRLVPPLSNTRIESTWAGIVDVTPDAMPVLGPVGALAGLSLATGLSSHGFGIGPGVGRVIADLITNRQADIDVSPFRIERFRDRRGLRTHEHL